MPQERRRDNQQWLLDWMVKTTGRVQNFFYDHREVPPEVKSYRMIPRVMEKHARHQEQLARAAEQHGHRETARELYFKAADTYRIAQHAIFQDDNPEKIYLHGKLIECYDGVIRNAEYPIERVEIPFEGKSLQAVFHVVPGRPKAPAVLWLTGMDSTKEAYPDPINNHFLKRGMHLLCLDGPGQGISNLRKIRVTLDNYERSGRAVIDWLVQRPEVDANRIAVAGFSMGSYWGMQIAAVDKRVKAVATAAACYGSKRALFDEASPRFKQVYMYMAGIHDEAEFDVMAEQMRLDRYAGRITCPTLQVNGEYDPLSHLEEAYEVYEQVAGPREFWMIENDAHAPFACRNLGGLDARAFLADWLRDALAGKKPADLNREVIVKEREGIGPYADPAPGGFWLPGRLKAQEIAGQPIR